MIDEKTYRFMGVLNTKLGYESLRILRVCVGAPLYMNLRPTLLLFVLYRYDFQDVDCKV